ncbi:hypothetical protein EVAR_61448_1 [Eumeta japonica]|uniref:Mariner Mos1 transposase n=1 Tax=Eumeta variegata TaxID=151549 RepID=A0A4C1Z1Z5_EUMVA|nr:hypothetical protein EVAR_61448_1 [Eumeta japonica]
MVLPHSAIEGSAEKSIRHDTLAVVGISKAARGRVFYAVNRSRPHHVYEGRLISPRPKYFAKKGKTPKEILKTWYQFFRNLRLRIRWSKNGLAYFNKDERAVKMILAQGVL